MEGARVQMFGVAPLALLPLVPTSQRTLLRNDPHTYNERVPGALVPGGAPGDKANRPAGFAATANAAWLLTSDS